MSSLNGRVAIVTGSAMNIGRATALMLAREGASVMVHAKSNGEGVEETRKLVAAAGGKAGGTLADLSTEAGAKSLIDATMAQFGRIDILVNNAVSSTQGHFDALSDEEWQHHIDVKLLGYVRCAREALPWLKKSGRGRVINIAGMTARIVSEFRMTNGVVNAGVTNFTKHLAEQVGRDGVTVNAIHPGYTETPRLDGILKRWAELEGTSLEESARRRLKEIPIGRFIKAEDLANLVVFLCSDAASAITGQAIAVDGGSGRAISY